MLTDTGALMSYNQGKNSHSGILQKWGQYKVPQGLAIMGHGVEERRPWTNEETGALGEHLSARNEQLRLWRKEEINWEVFHGQGDI